MVSAVGQIESEIFERFCSNWFYLIEKQDGWPAQAHFLPNCNFFMINFCKRIKNEKRVFNLHYKRLPEISSPPKHSAFLGLIDLLKLRLKVQKLKNIFESLSENIKLSSELLILEMQTIILEKNDIEYEKSHYILYFYIFHLLKVPIRLRISQHVSRVTFHLQKFVHWDFDRRSPGGTFGDKLVETPRRTILLCKLWYSQPIKFPFRAIKRKLHT